MDYKVLINRKIIDILIGDVNVYDEYKLPYLSGPNLCDLSSEFGLPKTYNWSSTGGNQSRWMYMQDLLEHLNAEGRVSALLSRLFDRRYFENLSSLSSPELVTSTYQDIVDGAVNKINCYLMLAQKELRMHNGKFDLVDISTDPVVKVPKVKAITRQYIRELPERIKDDIVNKDFDSVITKSRTLLEEVLIFIIEKITHERYNSKGDLVKIYQETTELLGMRQKKEWDVRVNELLGGLHKIVQAISSMRNINSDAHGAGAGRITIKEREAILVANSSMMLADYWLAIFEEK